MKTIPAGLPEFDGNYSNFDHAWDDGAREAVESGEFFCDHAAWEFHGKIWKGEDGRYYELVRRYHAHVDTVSAETLDELIEAVCEKWGRE